MAQAQKIQNELSIMVFPMVNNSTGCRLIENSTELPDFYDIELLEYWGNGQIESLQEYDNLTLEQTSPIIEQLERKYPLAGLDWIYC